MFILIKKNKKKSIENNFEFLLQDLFKNFLIDLNSIR